MPRREAGPKKCLFCNKEIVFKPSDKGAWVHVDTNECESKEPEYHTARPMDRY